MPLPIDAALPELTATLAERTTAVLVAPPGAGKTTRVPLALAAEPWAREKKILVLEPRRLAARAAAEFMAKSLGETVGDTVGYRVRFGTKVSRRTRIEVVTEGVFTGLILDDPSLDGIGAVLFDEFHERSLDADLGLALARDAQQGLREDLRLVVMSATIDGARIAKALGDAPVIASEGRAFPVETRYLGRDPGKPIEAAVADAALRALRAEPGSILAFLPGAGEIRRTETLVKERVTDPAVDVVTLFGALDAAVQDRAIAPAPAGRRKVVLATSIAETSITIEGVRVVIDSGLARVPRYEPDVGVTRLETVRVSRAAADQRRGRAGRTEPGVVLPPVGRAADRLARGVRATGDSRRRSLLVRARSCPMGRERSRHARLSRSAAGGRAQRGADPPRRSRRHRRRRPHHRGRQIAQPHAVAAAARPHGGRRRPRRRRPARRRDCRDHHRARPRRHRRRPPPPSRRAGPRPRPTCRGGAPHGPPLGGGGRRYFFSLPPRGGGSGWGGERVWRSRAKLPATPGLSPQGGGEQKRDRLRRSDPPPPGEGAVSTGAILALAYPERIAKNRGAATGAFLLANGRGAAVDPASPLAREPYLAVAELVGSAAQSRITLAAAIDLVDIEARFADRIVTAEEITCDPKTLALRGRRSRRLGAIALGEQPLPVEASEATATTLADAIVKAGVDRLPWTKALAQWRDRVAFLRRAEGEEWPDLSDAGLASSAAAWLVPLLFGKTALAQVTAAEFEAALHALLPHALRRRLDAEAPTHFDAPSGSHVPIDYTAEEGPKLAIRVQELFGLNRHPTIAGGRTPLVIELLSPAHRPVQVTRDLPNFWRGSYAAVKSEMRGRYPRHPWPDDPAAAPATRRAKPRGT